MGIKKRVSRRSVPRSVPCSHPSVSPLRSSTFFSGSPSLSFISLRLVPLQFPLLSSFSISSLALFILRFFFILRLSSLSLFSSYAYSFLKFPLHQTYSYPFLFINFQIHDSLCSVNRKLFSCSSLPKLNLGTKFLVFIFP